ALMPRWPTIEICWRCDSTSAAGVSVAKSWKRRPFSGMLATIVESTNAAASWRVVSMASAATVTSSVRPPTASVKFTSAVRPTPTSTCAVVFAKPWPDAVTRYFPAGSSTRRYRPFSSVCTVCEKPVPVFTALTVAPAMTAPAGSLTVPAICPVLACDWAAACTLNNRQHVSRQQDRNFALLSVNIDLSSSFLTIATAGSALPDQDVRTSNGPRIPGVFDINLGNWKRNIPRQSTLVNSFSMKIQQAVVGRPQGGLREG